jgi:hypothetical protein
MLGRRPFELTCSSDGIRQRRAGPIADAAATRRRFPHHCTIVYRGRGSVRRHRHVRNSGRPSRRAGKRGRGRPGDDFLRAFPNIRPIRGARRRTPEDWIASLGKMIELGPEDFPLPEKDRAAKLVGLIGGPEQVLARGREALAASEFNGRPNVPTTSWRTTAQTPARRGSRPRRSLSSASGRSTPSPETTTCHPRFTCCGIVHRTEALYASDKLRGEAFERSPVRRFE